MTIAEARGIRMVLPAVVLLGSANSILFAVFPPAGRAAGLADWQIGLTFAFSAAAYMVSAAWWGRASDRHGRRPVIVIGLIGYGIGTAAFGIAMDLALAHVLSGLAALTAFILARIVGSLTSGGVAPAAQALIVDHTPTDRRAQALGSITASFALGNIIRPAVGAALVGFGLSIPLYASAAMAIAVAALARLALPPPTPAAVQAETTPKLAARDPRVLPWLICVVLYFVCLAGGLQIVPFRVQDALKLDSENTARLVSLMFMASGAMAVAFQLLVVRRSKWRPATMILVGLSAAAIAYAGMAVARADWQFLGLSLLLGAAGACVLPGLAASASLAVSAREQGAVAGLIGAAQAGGFLIGPASAAALYGVSGAAPFWAAAALCVSIALAARRSG